MFYKPDRETEIHNRFIQQADNKGDTQSRMLAYLFLACISIIVLSCLTGCIGYVGSNGNWAVGPISYEEQTRTTKEGEVIEIKKTEIKSPFEGIFKVFGLN